MAQIVQFKDIILASISPLRRELLQSAGLRFEVMASPYDEEEHKSEVADLPIPQQALYLAEGKAKTVSERYPDHLVIAADQIGEFDGRPLFKPHNAQAAVDMLFSMQGKTHYQHCAACIYQQGEKCVGYIDSIAMTMRELSRTDIEAYVDIDQPLSCCGAYRYEGIGKYLFAKVDGCYESILGLPLLSVLNYLQDVHAVRLISASDVHAV